MVVELISWTMTTIPNLPHGLILSLIEKVKGIPEALVWLLHQVYAFSVRVAHRGKIFRAALSE